MVRNHSLGKSSRVFCLHERHLNLARMARKTVGVIQMSPIIRITRPRKCHQREFIGVFFLTNAMDLIQ